LLGQLRNSARINFPRKVILPGSHIILKAVPRTRTIAQSVLQSHALARLGLMVTYAFEPVRPCRASHLLEIGMKQKSLLLLTLTAALLLSACAAVPIGRIAADPSRYLNRTVHVQGTVTTSYGLLGAGGYQVEDSSGKIYVLSRTGIPNKGSRVAVTGTVMSGMNIAGHSLGAAIRESHHKVEN
jgi:hypothetical protein